VVDVLQFLDIIHLNCILKSIGEEQDGVVGRWLREDDGGWRGRGGIAVVKVTSRLRMWLVSMLQIIQPCRRQGEFQVNTF